MATTSTQIISDTQREGIYRRNFFLFTIDGTFFYIALGLISASTVIPDFVRQLTDSEILIGFSSSMFEILWLLPQLFIARYLMRVTRKKWWFVGPSIPVRFSILTFAIIAFLLGAEHPGWILVTFLICYGFAALGDGIVGVPWVEIAGSSLDNKWRARFFGLHVAISGLIMLVISPFMGKIINSESLLFPNNYIILFAISGLCLLASLFPILFLREIPSKSTSETIPPFSEYIPELGRVLRDDHNFRSMVIVRMLTSLYTMATPFYIGFATIQLGLSSGTAVSNLIAMQTLGTLLGAFTYSWMGNKHNLLYIRLALTAALLLPVSALLAGLVGPLPLYIGFFLSGLAMSNLFSSYLNWIIMNSPEDKRPVYTGLFNTISAITLLTAPLIGGTIAQTVGYQAVFVVSLLMALGALYMVTQRIHNTQPETIDANNWEQPVVEGKVKPSRRQRCTNLPIEQKGDHRIAFLDPLNTINTSSMFPVKYFTAV